MSQPSASPAAPSSLPAKIIAVLSSFGLATVVLIFLIITLLGTLDQVENGLFASQKKYFESFIVVGVDLGKTHIPIVLPGGALLMVVLFGNMLLASALRMKDCYAWIFSLRFVKWLASSGVLWFLLVLALLRCVFSGFRFALAGVISRLEQPHRQFGLVITHLAILFLLLAGFVSFFFKKEGNLALFEGQVSDEFQSYHDSVIEIERTQPASADGKRKALVIPGEQFQDLTEGRARTFVNKDLPFDLVVMNYEENAEPRRARPDEQRKFVVDGFYLQTLPKQKEAEVNLDAAIVKVRDRKSGGEQQGIIWRGEAAPFTFRAGEETFCVRLARRVWKLPFAVRLDKFEMENHPGTARARKFTSHVTKLTPNDKGADKKQHEEKKIITMNAPLREGGNVLFQASFSQNQAASGMMMRSVFAVVRNPSDQWPLYALIAAGVGLLIHMGGQLVRFLKRARSKKAAHPNV